VRAESLREVVHAEPFRAFRLILASGERLPVPHPEWVWLLPKGRTVGWTDEDERVKLLDVGLLLGVEMDTPVPAGPIAPNPDGGA
jgi:hypothetical protein